jgi:hypothetical protein
LLLRAGRGAAGHSRRLFSIEKWVPGKRLAAGLLQVSIL